MAKTRIGAREVLDSDIGRSDLNISTSGEALIRKVLPGSGINIAWTGVDPGTGDVTITATGGVGGDAVALESYELQDLTGGQQLTATPVTINFNGPRIANANFTYVGGELEFLVDGLYFILGRVTADITAGTSRSESQFYLEQDIGTGWASISGTTGILYHRNSSEGGNTANVSCIFNATAGDKVRIQAYRASGTSTIITVPEGSSLLAINLIGAQGPIGPIGATGPAGTNGTDGVDGVDGADGSQIYTGFGAPSDTLGQDSDIYINTGNNEYYQKVGGTWGLPIGVLGSGGSGGITDHDQLVGLLDDDHPQYHTDARGDARYALIDHGHTLEDIGDFALNLQKIETLYWMGLT